MIEVIIAAAILAIALTGIITAMYRTSQLNESFGKRNLALKGAENMMAQIKAQPRSDGGQKIIDYIDDQDVDASTPEVEFDIDGLEQNNGQEGLIDLTDQNGYVVVNVLVRWEDVLGTQDLSITSYIYTFDQN